MDKTKLYAVISTMAILHNGKRYEQGDKLELTDEEAERISLYVKFDEDDEKRKQAETEAEKARLEAEEKARLAAEEKARKEAEKANKNNKDEGKE